jgi:hypothetical protein
MYVLYFSSFNDLMYFYCYLGCMAIMFLLKGQFHCVVIQYVSGHLVTASRRVSNNPPM